MSQQTIWVVGDGLLHVNVVQSGQQERVVVRSATSCLDIPDGADVDGVVTVHDDWQRARDLADQRWCRAMGHWLLPSRLEDECAFIGPQVEIDSPCCLACAKWRYSAVNYGFASKVNTESTTQIVGSLAPTLRLVAELVWACVRGIIEADQPSLLNDRQGAGRVCIVNWSTLEVSWHKLRPVDWCSQCGSSNRAPLLNVMPISSFRADDDRTFRVASAASSAEGVGPNELLDDLYGPIMAIALDEDSPLPSCSVTMPGAYWQTPTMGFGGASSERGSQIIAFFESVERYADTHRDGPERAIRAAYRDLGSAALDPASVGGYDGWCQKRADFQLVPYSPSLTIRWIYGYSFRYQSFILVPEQLAYSAPELTPRDERILRETSNGNAVGSCVEEAALHGILEVIERDTFLMAWYGKLSVAEIVYDETSGDLVAKSLIAKLRTAGFQVFFFNVTNDFKIPAVWALAVYPQAGGAATFTAACAKPYFREAVRGALTEVAINAFGWKENQKVWLRSDGPDRLRNMWADHCRVRTLEDHADLYTLPESFDRMGFLFPTTRRQSYVSELSQDERKWPSDIGACLRELVSRVVGLGLDVIVVDKTPREGSFGNICVVKVIIPGAIPMTFGHIYRRTAGLHRLLTVPAELGYWATSKEYDDLDFAPHPFP